MLFDRFCEVTIKNTQSKSYKDLRISFEVVKSQIAKDNIIKIDIYNLSQDSQRLICQKDSTLVLKAGYVHDVISEIASGDITKAFTSNTETDSVTTIYASDGVSVMKYNYISISTSNSATLKQITDIITKQSGVFFKIRDIDFNLKTQGAYSDVGSIDSILDSLTTYFDFTWSFQNGQIVIKGNKRSGTVSMILNSSTGLLYNPESQKKLVRSIEKSKSDLDSNQIKIFSLMLPKLQIHDIIEVESRAVNGVFKINKITHQGDTHNTAWYTKLEIVNADDTSEYN